jgi:ribosomal protein S18 acetylase RimI-like enzyme
MPKHEIAYREATEEDLPAIVGLLNDDELGQMRNPLFAAEAEAYRAAFAEMATDPNNRVIVALNGTEIVGCYQLTFIRGLSFTGGLRAQIESVRIASHLRGKGLGEAMMRDAIARAHKRSCILVQLTTDVRRAHTRRFYERLGFTASHHGMKLKF